MNTRNVGATVATTTVALALACIMAITGNPIWAVLFALMAGWTAGRHLPSKHRPHARVVNHVVGSSHISDVWGTSQYAITTRCRKCGDEVIALTRSRRDNIPTHPFEDLGWSTFDALWYCPDCYRAVHSFAVETY